MRVLLAFMLLCGSASYAVAKAETEESAEIKSFDDYWVYTSINWASEIAFGRNGHMWVLSREQAPGGFITYRRVSTGWQRMPGAATRIAVDAEGKAWVTNEGRFIYHFDGAQFQLSPGRGMDVIVSPTDEVYVLGVGIKEGGIFDIWRWTGKEYVFLEAAAKKIAAEPNGTLWKINGDLSIWRKTAGVWKQVEGMARDIAISSQGDIWIIGTEPRQGGFAVYRRTGDAWKSVPSPIGGEKIYADPQGVPWIITTSQLTYKGVK